MVVTQMVEASALLRDDVETFADALVAVGSVHAVYNLPLIHH
mgnify:CR=1 FL=1